MAGEIAVVSESRLKDPEVFAAVHGKRAGFQNPVLPISRIWASQELAYAPSTMSWSCAPLSITRHLS